MGTHKQHSYQGNSSLALFFRARGHTSVGLRGQDVSPGRTSFCESDTFPSHFHGVARVKDGGGFSCELIQITPKVSQKLRETGEREQLAVSLPPLPQTQKCRGLRRASEAAPGG